MMNDEHIKLLKKLVASSDFHLAEVWVKHDKIRVYFETTKNIKLFADFNEGWKMNCWVEPCGQHTNWYISQKNKAIENIEDSFNLLTGFQYVINDEAPNEYSESINAEFLTYKNKVAEILNATA